MSTTVSHSVPNYYLLRKPLHSLRAGLWHVQGLQLVLNVDISCKGLLLL
jgi:hypothetical protein